MKERADGSPVADLRPSTQLDPFLTASLGYALGFVTGAVVLLLEHQNGFVRFHAFQSFITSVVVALGLGANVVFDLPRIPIVGFPLFIVSIPTVLVLWVLLIVKAYQGERFALPVLGRLASRLSEHRLLAPPSHGR